MTHPQPHIDPRRAEVRVEWGMARAEVAMRSVTIAHAEQLAAIELTLRDARAYPEVFLDHSLLAVDPDAPAFAERAAIADLAVRLGLAEQTVRSQAHEAHMLRTRTPRVWAAFREGDISVPNARVVAELVTTLEPQAWPAFESSLLELVALAPARFRLRARAAAERAQSRPAAERHRLSTQERRVWADPDRDGMAWFGAYLPAEAAQRAMAHVDAVARSLAAHPDETRTLAQVQADVAADLLAGVPGSRRGASVSVAVTVPVMTLLGRSEEPGILEGYGPIDAATARELAAHAPSFARILTDPVTGTVLDVDRSTYRVPADLKRWLGVRDGGCTFPGCGRSTRNCDIDHTTDWAKGGTTSAGNLAHLCRHHHRIKHNTRWKVEQTGDGLRWTSPTGLVTAPDPPPF
ncbi:MAG: hypothetical protein JWP85_524 [Rhodoglobus sp.]|nr:hypothetical protein [Rhodoglobus sp.]